MKQIRSNIIVTISSFIDKITKDATQNGKLYHILSFLISIQHWSVVWYTNHRILLPAPHTICNIGSTFGIKTYATSINCLRHK